MHQSKHSTELLEEKCIWRSRPQSCHKACPPTGSSHPCLHLCFRQLDHWQQISQGTGKLLPMFSPIKFFKFNGRISVLPQVKIASIEWDLLGYVGHVRLFKWLTSDHGRWSPPFHNLPSHCPNSHSLLTCERIPTVASPVTWESTELVWKSSSLLRDCTRRGCFR